MVNENLQSFWSLSKTIKFTDELDEEYDDEEGEYEDEEYEDEFVEEGDEYVGGPDLGAGAYNQNIMDGIQAKSYTEQPRRQRSSRKRRKRRGRGGGPGETGGNDDRTMGDEEEEEEYDDDYDNEGNAMPFDAEWFLVWISFWILREELKELDWNNLNCPRHSDPLNASNRIDLN